MAGDFGGERALCLGSSGQGQLLVQGRGVMSDDCGRFRTHGALLLRIAFAMRGGDAIFVVSLLAVWHFVHGRRGGGGSDGPDRGVAL